LMRARTQHNTLQPKWSGWLLTSKVRSLTGPPVVVTWRSRSRLPTGLPPFFTKDMPMVQNTLRAAPLFMSRRALVGRSGSPLQIAEQRLAIGVFGDSR
jgi:hypothetical protein